MKTSKVQVLTFVVNNVKFHVVKGVVTLARCTITGRFVKLNKVTQAFNRVLCAARNYNAAVNNNKRGNKALQTMYKVTGQTLLNAMFKLGFTRNTKLDNINCINVYLNLMSIARQLTKGV